MVRKYDWMSVALSSVSSMTSSVDRFSEALSNLSFPAPGSVWLVLESKV